MYSMNLSIMKMASNKKDPDKREHGYYLSFSLLFIHGNVSKFRFIYTVSVCPRSFYPFYIVSYNIKWVKTPGQTVYDKGYVDISLE